MAKKNYLTAPVASDKTPAGIPYILGNEAGERFSFYGMRCILVFFMTHLLLNNAGKLAPMTEEQSKVWFHLFVHWRAHIRHLAGQIQDYPDLLDTLLLRICGHGL